MDLQLNLLTPNEDTHICTQENRGDEIWLYCPICKEYVRKFDNQLNTYRLTDSPFKHWGTIYFTDQPNMN